MRKRGRERKRNQNVYMCSLVAKEKQRNQQEKGISEEKNPSIDRETILVDGCNAAKPYNGCYGNGKSKRRTEKGKRPNRRRNACGIGRHSRMSPARTSPHPTLQGASPQAIIHLFISSTSLLPVVNKSPQLLRLTRREEERREG